MVIGRPALGKIIHFTGKPAASHSSSRAVPTGATAGATPGQGKPQSLGLDF